MSTRQAQASTAADFGTSLQFGDVEGLLKRCNKLLAGEAADLSQVERLDSAGVALLLELTRRARAQGRTLRIHGLQPRLRSLLRFFAVEDLLYLEG